MCSAHSASTSAVALTREDQSISILSESRHAQQDTDCAPHTMPHCNCSCIATALAAVSLAHNMTMMLLSTAKFKTLTFL